MKIGIFDSGIGGLSVLHEAMRRYPHATYIYYADKNNVPYGEKTREQVLQYVKEILDFLIEKKCDAIVIACNTATSVATKELRSTYPIPIIGMEPAVKKAVELYGSTNKKILVAATPITVSGDKLNNLISSLNYPYIDTIALPQLVRFAEKGEFDTLEVKNYLNETFKDYCFDEYEAIVLGCTHFNYFKDELKKLFGKHIHFVDGNKGTITHLFNKLEYAESEFDLEVYYSSRKINQEEMKDIVKYFYRLDSMYKIK